ncbi:hypothetical protein HID58_059764 [Brassica napus]|uniref:Uncharacterized protein n=1 Tax=Brassica napus TaxID=3708 RepID=A0ABQ7ZTZ4_BRANA|nr:hypothetical protein HID58_059764 [Brassica napus]
MGSLVNVKEATVITPSDQTPSSVLSLSALDSQLFLRFTIEYLLVYSPVSDPMYPTTSRALTFRNLLTITLQHPSEESEIEIDSIGIEIEWFRF